MALERLVPDGLELCLVTRRSKEGSPEGVECCAVVWIVPTLVGVFDARDGCAADEQVDCHCRWFRSRKSATRVHQSTASGTIESPGVPSMPYVFSKSQCCSRLSAARRRRHMQHRRDTAYRWLPGPHTFPSLSTG